MIKRCIICGDGLVGRGWNAKTCSEEHAVINKRQRDRIYQKKFLWRDREKKNARTAEWRKRNKDKAYKATQKWREKNKDRLRISYSKYHLKHWEREAKYRAAKAAAWKALKELGINI